MSDELATAQDTTDAVDTTSTADTSTTVDASADVTTTEKPVEGEATTTETVETKETEGDAPDAEKGDGDGEETAQTYEDFTMPDGFEVNDAAMEKAIPVFKELGLDQESAQKAVSLFSEVQADMLAEQADLSKQQVEAWTNEIKTDWGPKFDDELAVAAKGTDFFDDFLRSQLPEAERTAEVTGQDGKVSRQPVTPFRDALDQTGAGNHPAIIKVINRVGQMISEDGVAETTRAGQLKTTMAERMYAASET